jgi:hypothetical protein
MRPVGMAGHLRLLPGRQLAVDVAQGIGDALFEPRDLLGDIDGLAAVGELLELEDLAFQIGDGLFEVEIIVHSS